MTCKHTYCWEAARDTGTGRPVVCHYLKPEGPETARHSTAIDPIAPTNPAEIVDPARSSKADFADETVKPRVYVLRRDGVEILRGSEYDCWHWIHSNQPYSVDWATRWEGFTIEEATQT